jgi:hypothetical protein
MYPVIERIDLLLFHLMTKNQYKKFLNVQLHTFNQFQIDSKQAHQRSPLIRFIH